MVILCLYMEAVHLAPPVHCSWIRFSSLCFRIKHFLEKPQEGVTASRLASVVFYCLRKETLSHLSDFLLKNPDVEYRTLGRLWVSALVQFIF